MGCLYACTAGVQKICRALRVVERCCLLAAVAAAERALGDERVARVSGFQQSRSVLQAGL